MFNKNFKAVIYLLALLLAGNVKSQISPPGSWQIINTEIALNNKWSIFSEGQLRSQKIFSEFFFMK